MATVEALYIYDEHKYVSALVLGILATVHILTIRSNLILSHKYVSEATPASIILPLYLERPAPRPSVIYLPSTSPPTIVHSVVQGNILLISPSTRETEPLAVLEFLHRVVDALEEFLGTPLLASKITSNYDVVAQVISEIADGGIPSQSEANALRDVVETGPGALNNLLGNLGIQGSAPSLGAGPTLIQRPQLQSLSSQGSAIPWRRSNVRHTSNEMYVDMVEEIDVILAPSGRPIAAFANGNIAFTSKVSGIPDITLTLSTGGKGGGMGNRGDQLRAVMQNIVFHPCVRLNRWKSDGIISFVPPDGRFALCGYEVDLLGPDLEISTTKLSQLNLPVSVEMNVGLGQAGNEFDVRLQLPSFSSSRSAAQASLQSHLGTGLSAFKAASSGGDSKIPVIDKLSVRIPIPPVVRNVSELRAGVGEALWTPAEGSVEWRLSSKELQTINASVTLRCTVQGPLEESDDSNGGAVLMPMQTTTYDYDDDAEGAADGGYQGEKQSVNGDASTALSAPSRSERNRALMPTSALLSFSIKGWLISGLKVDSLLLNTKASKGIGSDVKPFKGVKYLTVSRDGIEARC